jgi:cytosine deaminase
MSLCIKNAKLRGEPELKDIYIDEGLIEKISPVLPELKGSGVFESLGAVDSVSGDEYVIDLIPGADTIDACGNLVTPPFVDSHVHLDAAPASGQLHGGSVSGALPEVRGIRGEQMAGLRKEVIKASATEVAKWYAANGVLHIRTHADTTDPTLAAVESLLDVRYALRDIIDIQVVGFPRSGIYTDRANLDLLKEAIRMGVDAVGGAPNMERTHEDGVRDVETVYELAEAEGKLVDIHVDETGDPQSRFVEVMERESVTRDYGARSAASHACSMHNYDDDYACKLIGSIAEAGISVITNPFDDSVLRNGRDGYPPRRGAARVDELAAAGVNVSIGHDSIVDQRYLMGTGSMLATANLLMHMAHMNSSAHMPKLFDMITVNSARLMCLEGYGLEPGNQADLVILDGRSEEEALRLRSECLYVIRKGNVLCKTDPARRRLRMNETFEELVDFKM